MTIAALYNLGNMYRTSDPVLRHVIIGGLIYIIILATALLYDFLPSRATKPSVFPLAMFWTFVIIVSLVWLWK